MFERLIQFAIEQRITFPIETAMAGLPGLQQTRSLSRSGLSQVCCKCDLPAKAILAAFDTATSNDCLRVINRQKKRPVRSVKNSSRSKGASKISFRDE